MSFSSSREEGTKWWWLLVLGEKGLSCNALPQGFVSFSCLHVGACFKAMLSRVNGCWFFSEFKKQSWCRSTVMQSTYLPLRSVRFGAYPEHCRKGLIGFKGYPHWAPLEWGSTDWNAQGSRYGKLQVYTKIKLAFMCWKRKLRSGPKCVSENPVFILASCVTNPVSFMLNGFCGCLF